jgi:thiamine-monophosphate kinase
MADTQPVGEFGLIAWLRAHAVPRGQALVGIGDDCAVLRPAADRDLVVTTDMLMDGRHFALDRDGPAAVGAKALGVNLSDIAAMAGRPLAAVVAVALPKSGAVAVAQGMLAGMRPVAERFGVELVGGDTNGWDGPLVISVTVLGDVPASGAVLRSGARPGDAIAVTGPLGGSLLGRHLRPEPRIDEAQALVSAARLHALIDISDGLASDLGHILDQSGGLGAVLNAEQLPIHADALAMSARDGRTPLDHALNDGEDFELCVVLPASDFPAAQRVVPVLRLVGVVVAQRGLWLRGADGSMSALEARGFDHLRAGPP